MNTLLSYAGDFFLSNLWWIIALTVFLAFCVYFLISFLVTKKKGKKVASKNEYLLALGGENNILSHKRVGSRIVLELKDYSLLDKTKLKEAGIAGFIQKSDRLTLITEASSEEVYRLLFGE